MKITLLDQKKEYNASINIENPDKKTRTRIAYILFYEMLMYIATVYVIWIYFKTHFINSSYYG